jgi:hypothetical protein
MNPILQADPPQLVLAAMLLFVTLVSIPCWIWQLAIRWREAAWRDRPLTEEQYRDFVRHVMFPRVRRPAYARDDPREFLTRAEQKRRRREFRA